MRACTALLLAVLALSAHAIDREDSRSLLFVPYPITEPAVGSGLLAGPVWLRKGPESAESPTRNQASGFGGLWTDGGSRGIGGFDRRAWANGQFWTTAVAVDADLALRYDGLEPGGDQHRAFGLAITGVSLSGELQRPGTPDRLGLRLFASQAELEFAQGLPPELSPGLAQDDVNGLELSFLRDRRDAEYSPTRGAQIKVALTHYASWLGASFRASHLGARYTHYGAGIGHGVLGVRVQGDASSGDSPFYLRPFVSLRGVPALRYAGERVVSLELEHRWVMSERWDLLAFGGAGHARSQLSGASGSKSVAAGGLGVRFKSIKYFGVTFGVDVAHGPDGRAIYLQIGNPWSR